MAPVIIYGTYGSPPVRAVLITAANLSLKYEFKEVDLKNGDHLKPEFLKMNPQHTVPTIDDNGFYLSESSVICGYLVEKYGKNDSLYPKELEKRVRVDQKLHFCTGTLFPKARNIVFPILFLGKTEIPKQSEDEVIEVYGLLEKFLSSNSYDWIACDQLTIADILTIAIISTIQLIISIDSTKFPKLTAWISKCHEIPFYEINEGPAEQLSAHINKCIGRT